MKKRICIMLCLSMIISVFSWYSSYATENVVADESELVAPQMPQYEPSAPDTAVSEMPTDFELPHSTNDLLNEETDEHNTDDEYRVIKTQSGEFLAIDIKTRDVEIYVTDGYVPIPGAVVTLNNIDKISNEHGKVKFYDVPTNDTAYTIDVNCESLGFAHAEIYLGNFDFLESEIDKISDVNFTISYWNIDIEESYSNISLIADASEGQWSQSLSVFPASVYSYFVSYDGKIFVFDESMFYIYNENNDMWAEQTSLSGTVKGAVEYNGNIYVLIDRRAGYYWHYYVDVYNISNKSWQKSKVDVNSRYDCAFFETNGNLYFGPGLDYIVDDEYGYDTTGNSTCAKYDINSDYFDDNIADFNDTAISSSKGMGYNGKPFFLLFDSNLYELTDEGLELKRYLEGDSSSEKYFDEKYYSYDYDELSGTLYFIDAGTHKVITYSLETDELEEFDLDNVDPWIPSADKIKYIGGKLYVFNNKHDGKCTVFVISIPNDGDSDVNISEIGQIEHSCDIVMESNGVLYAISADGVMSKMRLDGPQKDYSKVAIGKEHSIYIKDDVAYTKGYNTYGQLGTGSNGSKDKYEIVDGIFERVTSVAAGDYTSYIITENNNLYAFGKNDKGQLGDGTTRNSSTPKFITSNVLKISAGAEHAVIMKTDGKAYAFGSNNHKQISSLDVEYYASPQYISNANNVSAGAYHTLLCGTYGLKTLGDNTYGQLGQINGQNIIMPNIGDIAAGKEHSAIISNGKIHTVGNNNYGQLGIAETSASAFTDTRVLADNVYAGTYETAYIKNGVVYQCGSKSLNSIYGTKQSEFKEIKNTRNIKDIAKKNEYTLGIDADNNLWRWGLMTDDISDNYEIPATPLKIHYQIPIVQVDAYREQTLAINEFGQLVSWGEGYYGDGSDKMVIHPYPIVIQGVENPIQVSRGKNHNLVLDKDGHVWGFGSNTDCPMGNLGGKVKIPTKLGGIDNVKKVAAGTEFSLFLKTDGTIWGVGKNDKFQLGLGDTENRSNPVQIGSGFSDINVGETSAIAIKNGEIYTWGTGKGGSLGRGRSENASSIPTKVSITLLSGEHFVQTAMSDRFCIVLTNFGNVYAWGDNEDGRLGLGDQIKYDAPVKITSLSNIVKIDCSNFIAFAVAEDGAIYSWGNSTNSCLGYETSNVCQKPTAIPIKNNAKIKAVSTGYNYSVIVDTDGNLYTFGKNRNGALGIYSEEAVLYNTEKSTTNTEISSSNSDDAVSSSFAAKAGEEHVIAFTAQKSGTYTFDFSNLTPGTTALVYRDSNFTTPYKKTMNGGSLEVGIEKNSTVYLKFVNTSGLAYSGKMTAKKTSDVVEDNKMIYMVLYDSYCGENDGLWPRYYGLEENEKYKYSVKFFINYLRIFKDTRVAFAISLRDLDFDTEPLSNEDIGEDSKSLSCYELQAKGLPDKTAEGCQRYYRQIIHNIVSAYNTLELHEKPNEFPQLYLGTPHFNGYNIEYNEYGNFANIYLNSVVKIYNKLTTEYSDGLPNINEELITGLYFGRENPEIRKSNEGPERLCLQYISDYIHLKSKKLLWIPYTLGKPSSLEFIGQIVNQDQYYPSDGSAQRAYFDIVAIQPGLYFYEVNSDTTDEEFTQTLTDLISCISDKNNSVYSKGKIVGGVKITDTKVTFQIEYDNSLITGRKDKSCTSIITEKVSRFSIIINNFKHYIYNNDTPICVYSGGPNEQNYDNSPGSPQNDFRHSNRNYITLWDVGHMKKYSDFFGNAGNLYSTYNGDLIYDITNGLVNNIWTPVIQPFFGGQLQFDTINKLF